MRYIADIEDRYGHFNSIEFDAPNDKEAKKIAEKHGFCYYSSDDTLYCKDINKEKAIEKIQYAVMQVSSVYACSAIFDEKTKVIEGRQKELEKAIVNLHDALKELK